MAKRVLCEIKTCEFTNIEYPVPYNGNCFFTEDASALQEFKKEVLAERPEFKGKLRIMTCKAQQKAYDEAMKIREHSRAYLEWRAYNGSKW